MMKKILFSSALILNSLVWAEEIKINSIHVQNVVIENTQQLKSDHLICLGSNWDKLSNTSAKNLEAIKLEAPEIFHDIDAEKTNCFALDEAPENLLKKLDDHLASLDKKVKGNIITSIKSDSMSLTCEMCKSENNRIELPKRSDIPDIKEIMQGPSEKPLRRQVGRALLLTAGMQAGMMTSLVLMPLSLTQWEKGWQKDIGPHMKRAFTSPPVHDPDLWYVNYVLHPIEGMIFYNNLRSQGASILASFLFSAAMSTVWEFGLEAMAEQPSRQDLFVTPIVGSVMGELAHQATRRMARNGFNMAEKIVITIINPSYVMNNGYKP